MKLEKLNLLLIQSFYYDDFFSVHIFLWKRNKNIEADNHRNKSYPKYLRNSDEVGSKYFYFKIALKYSDRIFFRKNFMKDESL